MNSDDRHAPGSPGLPAHWTSGDKDGVGTAFSTASRVWFSLRQGILNEIYFPRVDRACTQDLGLIVTDGQDFFSEEKRDTHHQTQHLAEGVPGYRLINQCVHGRYRIEKEVITAPQRDAVMQLTTFTPLQGQREEFHLYALLSPHLGNQGGGNSAWLDEYKGVPMLFAERNGYTLALACSPPFLNRSVGYVGTSDGWQDLAQHKRMTWSYSFADNGNVALTGEVDLAASEGTFLLVVGFGENTTEAGHRARASVLDDFSEARTEYVGAWQDWQRSLLSIGRDRPSKRAIYAISTAVLHVHEAKSFQGGIIASLSIPWGFARGDRDLGGYHLVWPRDLVETAGGLLAAGSPNEVRQRLHYLQTTQDADGHWPQNMWIAGAPYWDGVQMDETALPVLLVELARREGVLGQPEAQRLWPMVRQAAGYLVRNGPVTQEDRWETDPGYSPYTLAAEIAALLVAADLAESEGETRTATYLRDTADAWNANIERWCYVKDTDLDRHLGIEGHYVRIAPPSKPEAVSPAQGFVPIKERPPDQSVGEVADIVSPDALALVRFGLRAPDDPRIVNTVKAIDALLKADTPNGPAWRRYVADQYGEHKDGSPFDGSGVGRAWPLLTGERGHYELAAGRQDEAERLARAMEAFANEGGMIPEQVWDAPDIPERELFYGKPTGSSAPLVWAHAEYIKLRRSLREGRVFDMPIQTVQRYLVERTGSSYHIWRFNQKASSMPAGKSLRIDVLAAAVVRWSMDNWHTVQEVKTWESDLGSYVADLPTASLPAGSTVTFTFYWPGDDRWEGTNFTVTVEPDRQ